MKPWYATKEEIPQGLEQFYKENNGRWELEVEGMVPSSELKEMNDRLNEFRSNNISLSQKLKDFEGKKFLSQEEQDEYDELKKKAEEIQDQNLIDAGKIDELVHSRTERMRADYENKIKAFEKRATKAEEVMSTYQGQLANVLVEAEVSKTLSAQGVSPVKGALSDVIARARGVWQVNEEGKLVALDPAGNPMYGQDPSSPLTMDEWSQTVAKEAPYLFMESKGSGGEGSKSGGTKGGDGILRIPRSDQELYNRNIDKIAKGEAVVVED